MHVLVVSAVALYRDGIADALTRRVRMDWIRTAGSASEALEVAANDDSASVVVLDMAMDGSAAVARKLAGRVRVLAIAVPSREDDVITCAETGVAGFLTTEASLDELAAALVSVSRGEALCSPWTAGVLLRRVAALARARPRPAGSAPLTARELEVVDLLDRGFSNKQIAQRLCIELPTVKNHVHHILDKLGVNRRGEVGAVIRRGAAATY